MNADSSKGEHVNNLIFEFYVDVNNEGYETIEADTWEILEGRLLLRKDGKPVALFNTWQYFTIRERVNLNIAVAGTAEPTPEEELVEVIYGSDWENNRERIHTSLYNGAIRVEVDYNRVSWEFPEDNLIWRVYKKSAKTAEPAPEPEMPRAVPLNCQHCRHWQQVPRGGSWGYCQAEAGNNQDTSDEWDDVYSCPVTTRYNYSCQSYIRRPESWASFHVKEADHA